MAKHPTLVHSTALDTSAPTHIDERTSHPYPDTPGPKPFHENGITAPGFLAAPPGPPVRPLSPDTLSNLSVDEYAILHAETLAPATVSDGNPAAEVPPSTTTSSASHSKSSLRHRLHASWIHNKGLVTMLFAQLFGTLMNVTTRILEISARGGRGLQPFHILFARMAGTVVLATAYMYFQKTPGFPWGPKEVRGLLVGRAVGGFFGVFGMYYSLVYLPLADATVITFLAPSLACWACSVLLKEPFTRVEQIGGLVSLVGVVLIARPASLFPGLMGGEGAAAAAATGDVVHGNGTVSGAGPDAGSYEAVTPSQRLGAVAVALVGVLGSASAFTTMRWIGKRAHPLISVNFFSVWCMLVSVVMMAVLPGVGFAMPEDARDWGLLLFLGSCGFVMQFLLAYGLAYEKSSRATNITYTQMLFALGFDRLIFGHSPTLLSIVGSSLILGPAVVVALQKGTGPTQGKDETAAGSAHGPTSTDVTGGDDESRVGLMADVALHEDEGRDRAVARQQEIELDSFRGEEDR